MYSLYELRFYLWKMKSSKPANTTVFSLLAALDVERDVSMKPKWEHRAWNSCVKKVLVADGRVLKLYSLVHTDATLLVNSFQHCWMLHAASVCTPCWELLHKVWNLSHLPRFLLFCDRRNVAQQCILLHSSSNIVGPRTRMTRGLQSLTGFSFPWCTAGPIVASVWPKPVGFRAVSYLWMGNNAYHASG